MFPRVAAYIADYPEQCLVNCAAGNNSPVTTAMGNDLASSVRLPFRTREWILNRIRRACQNADPEDLTAYHDVSKPLGLNGITKPFWEHLPGYDPALCVGPDLLHGYHRFWRDHILKWVIALIGKPEIDTRLRVIQPIVGIRHFNKGINNLTQWSGREDRELQRILLACIDGHAKIDSNKMCALRAIQDFGYLAQYRSHSEETLEYLRRALALFHSLLHTFIENGIRLGAKKPKKNAKKKKAHFRIPKLAGLHAYLFHIPELGSSPQFSTEITETLHQTMAKAAYRATNRREFVPQMCRFLDRTEKIRHMNSFIEWAISHRREQHLQAHVERFPVGATRNAILDAGVEVPLPSARDTHLRVWHTLTPHYNKIDLRSACKQYDLSTTLFVKSVYEYADGLDINFQGLQLDIWRQFRIRLATVQDSEEPAQARTVQALPPSIPPQAQLNASMPHGRCNCVLIHETDEARTTGIKGIAHPSHSNCLSDFVRRIPRRASQNDIQATSASVLSFLHGPSPLRLLVFSPVSKSRGRHQDVSSQAQVHG
jgi:hypothetical protein